MAVVARFQSSAVEGDANKSRLIQTTSQKKALSAWRMKPSSSHQPISEQLLVPTQNRVNGGFWSFTLGFPNTLAVNLPLEGRDLNPSPTVCRQTAPTISPETTS